MEDPHISNLPSHISNLPSHIKIHFLNIFLKTGEKINIVDIDKEGIHLYFGGSRMFSEASAASERKGREKRMFMSRKECSIFRMEIGN